MTLNKAKGRMFRSVGWTWNPVTGCTHGCPYCWARRYSERFNRSFEPQFRPDYLLDPLPDDGSWIFIGSMGDLFCPGFRAETIEEVFIAIEDYQGSNKFLLQTKNPVRAIEFLDWFEAVKDKVIIGTTLETNRGTLGNAPRTIERYASLCFFTCLGYRTFLSLEPLSDFDHRTLIRWVLDIGPEAVEIGLENDTNYLPKPPMEKISLLLKELRIHGIDYLLKKNLKHLEASQ